MRRTRKKKGEPRCLMWTKDAWINSQKSVARFYGQCHIEGEEFYVTIYGDLVWSGIWDAYHELGRDKVLDMLRQFKRGLEINEEAERVKQMKAEAKARANAHAKELQLQLDFEDDNINQNQ